MQTEFDDDEFYNEDVNESDYARRYKENSPLLKLSPGETLDSPFLKKQAKTKIIKLLEFRNKQRKQRSVDDYYMDEILFKAFSWKRVRTNNLI